MRTVLYMENLNHHKVKRLTVSPMDAGITRRLYKKWRREKQFKSSGNASICPGGAVYGSVPVSAGDTDSISGPGGLHNLYSYWACAPGLPSIHSRAQALQRLKPTYRGCGSQQERPAHWEVSTTTRRTRHRWRKQDGYERNPLCTGRWLWSCGKASLSPGTFTDRIHHTTEYERGDLWLSFPR